MSATFWCEKAWLPEGIAESVVVESADGSITAVRVGQPAPVGARRLTGLVFPGFANAHSHAFHRALRGRTHADGGTFWTWRTAMYALAERLDPDSYRALATAVYGEMALAGVTAVGEFHYLHHAPGGRQYADPNAMGEALIDAAAAAGIRITLLDTLYLAGGLTADGYLPLAGPQLRFGDGDVDGWSARADALKPRSHARIGAALHSVRAVPREFLSAFAHRTAGRPTHVHLSEQPAENESCQAFHGMSPTELLDHHGLMGESVTAVHATQLSTKDISLLGASRTGACFCPTTEADLADGIGPARELLDAGCGLSLGSDQHAVVDPLVDARSLEFGERLRTGERGRISVPELVTALTSAGHSSLGWPPGRLAVGSRADLVSVRTDSVRTAGCLAAQLPMAATASDVDTVVADGRIIAVGGEHVRLGQVGKLLAEAIEELWR